MKKTNKIFISIELILILVYILSSIILKIIPDTSNYGLGAVFSLEFWVTILIAFTSVYIIGAIMLVALAMIIFNVVQIIKRKDIKQPIRYILVISLIMIAIALIIAFYPLILILL
jgi:hypothetical protein